MEKKQVAAANANALHESLLLLIVVLRDNSHTAHCDSLLDPPEGSKQSGGFTL